MTYEIEKMGPVDAIRIFKGDTDIFPKAELYFALTNETITICWTNPEERALYKKGINGYTLIYDERTKEIPLTRFSKK